MTTFITKPIDAAVMVDVGRLGDAAVEGYGGRDFLLSRLSRSGGMATLGIEDTGEVSCSFINAPLRAWEEGEAPALRQAILAQTISPERVILGSFFFVHPDHQGKGLSLGLATERHAYWSTQGFTHALRMNSFSQQVRGWFDHVHPDLIDLGVQDDFGHNAAIYSLEITK